MRKTESPRIFRVLLEVHDLDRSRRFYESLLGCRGRDVGGGRVYFDCGSTILALLDAIADGGKGPAPIPQPLYLSTLHLGAVYRRAKKLDCLSAALIHDDPANPAGKIVERPWGERSFYAADPSGNPLCFVDASTMFTGKDRQAGAPAGDVPGRRLARPRVTHRSSGRSSRKLQRP